METVIKMVREKETPGTIVFKTVPSDSDVQHGVTPALKSQYVQKGTGFDDAQAIEVTVRKAA